MALTNFLDNNPQITNVYLCLDNDKPGKDATERISSEIIANEKYRHINLYVAPPPVGKDYNDTLTFMQEKLKERKLQAEIATAVINTPQPQINRKRSETTL